MGSKWIQSARKAAIGAAFAAICLLCQPLRGADFSAAEVISAGGRVSVIRDSSEWALFDGSTVHVGELIVTGEDGFAHLQVADGSSFCAGSARTGERTLRVSVDAALRAGIFKASGSFDPMGWSVGARRSFPRP